MCIYIYTHTCIYIYIIYYIYIYVYVYYRYTYICTNLSPAKERFWCRVSKIGHGLIWGKKNCWKPWIYRQIIFIFPTEITILVHTLGECSTWRHGKTRAPSMIHRSRNKFFDGQLLLRQYVLHQTQPLQTPERKKDKSPLSMEVYTIGHHPTKKSGLLSGKQNSSMTLMIFPPTLGLAQSESPGSSRRESRIAMVPWIWLDSGRKRGDHPGIRNEKHWISSTTIMGLIVMWIKLWWFGGWFILVLR